MRALLRNAPDSATSSRLNSRLAALANAQNNARYRYEADAAADSAFLSNGAQVANYEQEMRKALRCNYTGVSNLYWCDPSTGN